MIVNCATCETPVLNGFSCGCGVVHEASGPTVWGDGAEPGRIQAFKDTVDAEIQTRQQDYDQIDKRIDELRGRRQALAIHSVDWLKAQIPSLFAFGPKDPDTGPNVFADRFRQREILGGDIRVVVFCCELAVMGLVLALATVVWPITAIILAVTIYRFVRWWLVNAARSDEDKRSLAVEMDELNSQVVVLRNRRAVQAKAIKLLKQASQRATEALQGKEFAPEVYPSWCGHDPKTNSVIRSLSPITTGLAIFLFFPIGLIMLWRHPVLSHRKAWWWAGGIWGCLVVMAIRSGDQAKQPLVAEVAQAAPTGAVNEVSPIQTLEREAERSPEPPRRITPPSVAAPELDAIPAVPQQAVDHPETPARVAPPRDNHRNQAPARNQAAKPKKFKKDISLENYELIAQGMTREKVEAMLGKGTELSSTGEFLSIGYRTSNILTGSQKIISIVYEDGKVASKSKLGF